MINSKSPNKLEATEFVVNYISNFDGQYGMFLGEKRYGKSRRVCIY